MHNHAETVHLWLILYYTYRIALCTSKLVNVCMRITKIIKILTNFLTILAIVFVTAIGLTSDSTFLGGKLLESELFLKFSTDQVQYLGGVKS